MIFNNILIIILLFSIKNVINEYNKTTIVLTNKLEFDTILILKRNLVRSTRKC